MILQEISSREKSVLLFGSSHSNDQAQLEKIKKTLQEFNPEIVLVEGNFDKANFENEEDSIKLGGEMGYTSFICKQRGIPIESNDPQTNDDRDFIQKKYGNDAKNIYFSLRQLGPSTNEEDKQKIKLFLKKNLDEDFSEEKNYSDYFNPTLSINLFNEMTKELNKFRDEYMLKKIKESLKNCSKIFIIKGDYHLKTYINEIKDIVNES